MNLLLLSTLLVAWLISSSAAKHKNGDVYLREACSVTRYTDLCLHSLAPFSSTAKHSPSRWARAGVSVTIAESKRILHYLSTLKSNKRTNSTRRFRNEIALSDCVECFDDTLDNLHRSLAVLRKLRIGDFDSQVEDVLTWMSAAVTDEDTCLDGFEGRWKGRRVGDVVKRVSNVSYLTSNALALVNKLATAGPESLIND